MNPSQTNPVEESANLIFLVIPAFNAEKTIDVVLRSIPSFIKGIVVVDDCSRDKTANLVEKVRLSDNRVTLLKNDRNEGVGGAMLNGYAFAFSHGADIVVKMDSDGQMDPQYIGPIVKPILDGQADYVKGNRFFYLDQINRMPLIRRIGNLGLSFLLKMASGYWNIFDPTNGFTALSKTAYQSLNIARLDKRYFFESSLLIEAGIARLTVVDVYQPAFYGDEKSSLSEFKSFVSFPPRIFRGMLRRIFIQYYIRDFSALSIFLLSGGFSVLFGVLWGAYYWQKSIQTGIPATTGTVMIAVLPLIIGFQLILQSIVLDIQNTPKKK